MTFSNTTPLIALAGIGRLDLLPQLFGTIHLTESVVAECAAGGPVLVPDLSPLPWTVIVPADAATLPGLLLSLDRGEREALAMARKLGAERVIIDERIGRDMAELIGLPVVGKLGVLLKARELGLLPSFREAVTQMQKNGVRYHPKLLQRLCVLAGEP